MARRSRGNRKPSGKQMEQGPRDPSSSQNHTNLGLLHIQKYVTQSGGRSAIITINKCLYRFEKKTKYIKKCSTCIKCSVYASVCECLCMYFFM